MELNRLFQFYRGHWRKDLVEEEEEARNDEGDEEEEDEDEEEEDDNETATAACEQDDYDCEENDVTAADDLDLAMKLGACPDARLAEPSRATEQAEPSQATEQAEPSQATEQAEPSQATEQLSPAAPASQQPKIFQEPEAKAPSSEAAVELSVRAERLARIAYLRFPAKV